MKQILFIALMFPFFLASQDTIPTIEIQEVNVEAFRANHRTPITFKNIQRSEIDKSYFGQEPAELLWYTPSVTATSDAGNFFGYSYFRIRGIDQTRINMTLDGIPLNEPEDQGAYFSNYPDFFNSIQSIQIQRGVGTSANGVASFGGSINFESPDLFGEKKLETGLSYGSFNTNRLYAEYQSGKNDKGYGSYVRASNIATDGYVDNAYHRGKSVFFGAGRQFEGHTLKVVGFVGNQQNGMAWLGATEDMLNQSPTANGNSPDERDDFTQSLISVQYQKVFNKSKLNATVYHNFLSGNYDIDFANFGDTTGFFQKLSLRHHYYGAFLNMTHYLSNFKLIYGIHHNQFERDHIGSERTMGHLYKNTGYKTSSSAFVKGEYEIQNLLLFADVQARYATFDYIGSEDFQAMDWVFINPKVGASFQVSSKNTAYYSFGMTSREPARNDMFSGFDNLEVGVFQNLSPEHVQNHELGFKHRSKKLFLQLNGYLMSFENEIALIGAVGPNGLMLSDNVSNSYRAGVELDASYKATKDVSLFFQFTQSENKIITEDGSTNHVLSPSTIVNYGVEYVINKFAFYVTGKYQGESYLDLTNQDKIDGFSVLNFRAVFNTSHISYTLGVNNITNQVYNTSGYTVDYDPTDQIFNDEVRYFRQAPLNVFGALTFKM